MDVSVIETNFKQLWKELTFSCKIRPKTQFCILQHPMNLYRSYHKYVIDLVVFEKGFLLGRLKSGDAPMIALM